MHRLSIYSPLKKGQQKDFPMPPYLYLETGVHSGENDHVLLSPKLINETEIDKHVAELKSELDEFAIKAKKELNTLKKSMGINGISGVR